MTDETKPARKRRFFQVHLSTAIMLMFTAGGIIWANVTPRADLPYLTEDEKTQFAAQEFCFYQDNKGTSFPFEMSRVELRSMVRYGWPVKIYWRGSCNWVVDGSVRATRFFGVFSEYDMIFLDATVALTILFAGWFVCEWLISRRAARKES